MCVTAFWELREKSCAHNGFSCEGGRGSGGGDGKRGDDIRFVLLVLVHAWLLCLPLGVVCEHSTALLVVSGCGLRHWH